MKLPPLATLGPFIALLAACLFFATQSDRFLTGENLSLILQQVAVVGVGNVAGWYVTNDRIRSARHVQDFHGQDRWQMTRYFPPAFALIETTKHRPAVRPEIDSCRVPIVSRHGLPQYCEIAAGLRQSLPHVLPRFSSVK